MARSDELRRLVERKNRLKRRIGELNGTIQLDLAYAFEHYFEAGPFTYFKYEERLQNFEVLFNKIEDQVEDVTDLGDLSRVADRLIYVEDRLYELEGELYNRPRRRRRRQPSLGDFFKQFNQQNGEGSSASQFEVSSLSEAYHILGLEEGTGLLEVTAAFRRFAKEYHPDARGGDRSAETQLRKVVEAYQLIKQHLSESGHG